MVFTVVVVHDALIAKGLGFLASLAGADGIQGDGAAVVHACLLASRLSLDLLEVRLVWATGHRHYHQSWNTIDR